MYGLKNDKLAFWFQGLKGYCHIAVCYKAYVAHIVIYILFFIRCIKTVKGNLNWTLLTLQVENTDKQLMHCCFSDLSSPDFGITKNAFGLSSNYRKLMTIYSTKNYWNMEKRTTEQTNNILKKCWKETLNNIGNKNYWNRKLSKLLNNWKNMWNLQSQVFGWLDGLQLPPVLFAVFPNFNLSQPKQ